ncbi:MAG: hypothetical protein KDK36_13800, partial [Leptospiraceae bacterium]|nr:hypothetical protein [Leptospiraceae bacterium]
YPQEPPINASICKAANFYYREDYGKAYKILKKVKLPEKEEEKRKYLFIYHYFLADSSDKIGDLKVSSENWNILLEKPFDPIYMSLKEATIKRKLEINKFISEKQNVKKDSN